MTQQVINETVSPKEEGTRLDRWVKRRLPVTQGQIEKLLRSGQIRIDGARAKAKDRLAAGMVVRLPPVHQPTEQEKKARKASTASAKDEQFMREMVVYEDEDMFALNKPAGIAVQGGSKQGDRHIDGLLDILADGEYRPRLVHRLDKETSGLLLIARHPASAAHLSDLFRSRDMEKAYWAVTVGSPKPPAGQVRCWMTKGQGEEGREQMVQCAQNAEGARHAITDYITVSQAGQKAAWVALRPQTGRMHQLRFHMHELGTSILGDDKYITRREVPQGVAGGLHLHARALRVPRKNKKPLLLQAPLSGHMVETFKTLGFLEQEAGKDPFELFL